MLLNVACPVLPYFSKLSHKGRIFGNKFIEYKIHVLIFSTIFVQNIPNSKKHTARCYHNCTEVLCKHLLFLSHLTKPDFSRQIFEMPSHSKFYENPFSGSRVVACGQMDGQTDRQTDRHDKAKRVTSRNFAKALKTLA